MLKSLKKLGAGTGLALAVFGVTLACSPISAKADTVTPNLTGSNGTSGDRFETGYVAPSFPHSSFGGNTDDRRNTGDWSLDLKTPTNDCGSNCTIPNPQSDTDPAPTPEPSSLLLLGTGLLAFAAFFYRRARTAVPDLSLGA